MISQLYPGDLDFDAERALDAIIDRSALGGRLRATARKEMRHQVDASPLARWIDAPARPARRRGRRGAGMLADPEEMP